MKFIPFFLFLLLLSVSLPQLSYAQSATEVLTEDTISGDDDDQDIGVEDVIPTQPDGTETDPEPEPEQSTIQKIWAFLKLYGAELLLALLMLVETIVRITPTERDNAWFAWLKGLFDKLIPNLRKQGGTFK